MNTADIAGTIAADHAITREQAKRIVDSVLAAIAAAAKEGAEVLLPGFGKFKVRERPARVARNPRTGETMQVGASRKIAFQPAKALKDALNG